MPDLLLSLVRGASTWHFLLAVCLVDVCFLLLQLTPATPPDPALRDVMALQAVVRRRVEETSRRLQDAVQADHRARTLALLTRGVADLERHIANLKQELAPD